MGVKLGVFNTVIYGKIVGCSFKSFMQCIYIDIPQDIDVICGETKLAAKPP